MKKFSIVPSGYDTEEVNNFIDLVINKIETLNLENIALKNKIDKLENDIKENGNVEDKLSKAIIAVQETSDRIKELAKAESSMIIEDAKRNANSIIHEALLTAEKTNHESALLKKNIVVYKNKVKNLIKAQLEIAEDLDKVDI